MITVEDALAAYLDDYRHFRIDKILEWFLEPCHFVSDAEEVLLMPLPTREACRAGVERVLNWHREIGANGRTIVKQDIIELSSRISCVDIKSEIEDDAGNKLYDFEGVYTFVRVGAAWRIAAITHNQIPRLLRCVEAHRNGEVKRSA